MSKKTFITFTVLAFTLLVWLIVQNHQLSMRIDEVNNRISSLNNNVNNSLNNISYMFNSGMSKIEANSKPSYGESARIVGYEASSGTSVTEITFSLHQAEPDAKVALIARNTTDNTVFSATATSDNGVYRARLSLPPAGTYLISYESRGKSVISGELINDYNPGVDLQSRFKAGLNMTNRNSKDKPDEIAVDVDFTNLYSGSEALKLKSLTLTASSGGTVVTSWDITKNLADDNSVQSYSTGLPSRERIAIAAGDKSMPQNQPKTTFLFTPPSAEIELRLTAIDNMGLKYETVMNETFQHGSTPKSSGSEGEMILTK